jgi:hypothetical protein
MSLKGLEFRKVINLFFELDLELSSFPGNARLK